MDDIKLGKYKGELFKLIFIKTGQLMYHTGVHDWIRRQRHGEPG